MTYDNNITMSDDSDSQMRMAKHNAQQTFKYFWRELTWEYRRIIPALEMACVKVALIDPSITNGQPNIEHMWINEVEFDGKHVTGILINSPNVLTNIRNGDTIKVSMTEVSDWMFVTQGKVYGGFTVNLLRSRMAEEEREAHDQAWGYNFGDPEQIDIVYSSQKNEQDTDPTLSEHPMSVSMGESLTKMLKNSDHFLQAVDDKGCTMLHREALAGNATSVKILVEHGADKELKNNQGETALDLAKLLNWENVIDALSTKAAQ